MTSDKNDSKRFRERQKRSQFYKGSSPGDAVLSCSFCGKATEDCSSLVMGPRVSICDECVHLAVIVIRDEGHTVMQRHCNYMLSMRRMFKEIALLLRLQDPNCRLSGGESRRVLKIPYWYESRVGRGLIKACMKRLDEDKSNA